jgi:hypothetical protein
MTKHQIELEYSQKLLERVGALVKRSEDYLNSIPDWQIEMLRKSDRPTQEFTRWGDVKENV